MSEENEQEQNNGLAGSIQRLAVLFLVALFFSAWGFVVAYFQAFPFSIIDPMIVEVQAFLKGGQGEDRSAVERLTLHRQEKLTDFEYGGFHLRDEDFIDDGYLLISRFSLEHGQVVIELMKIDGFELVKRWIPPVEDILAKTIKRDLKHNSFEGYQAQNPVLLEDGGLVIIPGRGPLARIDKDAKLVWIVNKHFHHSIERDYQGNFVMPIVHEPPIKALAPGVVDGGYAIVSPDGEIVETDAVCSMLVNNGYRGLLLGVGDVRTNPLHINDVQPIHADIGTAKIGDLAFSCRNSSLVFLYRPSTQKIIWLKVGPWLMQHDVNILDNGEFSIFGNDTVTLNPLNPETVRLTAHSEIYIYNPMTDTVRTPYTEILKKVKMYSDTEGRSRVLKNGDVFIEQTQVNRLLRVSQDTLRWEWVNAISDKTTGGLNWCRYLYPEEVPEIWRSGE